MSKPSPDRVQAAWDLLKAPPSEEETTAEVARIAALTPRELDRELEEGGFDLHQVEANAARLRGQLRAPLPLPAVAGEPAPYSEAQDGSPSPSHLAPRVASAVDAIAPRLRPYRRRTEIVYGVTLALLVLGLAIGFALRVRRGPEAPIARPDVPSRPLPSEAPSSIPTPAMSLRAKAAAACDSQSWAECEKLLDQAAGLDPEGDRDPEVRALRPKPRP
jgi:hypothetical protein